MKLIYFESLFVVCLFIIYLLLWEVKRRFLFKTVGVNSEVLENTNDPLQKYFRPLIKSLTAFIIILIFVHSAKFQYYSAFSRFPPLEKFPVHLIGFIIGLCGLGICAIAQKTMGNSWRVGIDERKRTVLITNGIFTFVRNPT